MKTIGKTFSIVFAVIGAVALVAALWGAGHQFALAAICGAMAWVMWPNENENQSIKN